MVETEKGGAPTKRQKLKHVAPAAPAGKNDSKTIEKKPSMVLTNVNAEEYKVNPEEFDELMPKKPIGAQVFIQFHNAENDAMGE